MAKYEWFVVYPLLFIALFCSLTGVGVVKASQEVLETVFAKKVVADKVVTNLLEVVNHAGKTIAWLDGSMDRTTLRLNCDVIVTNKDGTRMVSITDLEFFGAYLNLYDADGRNSIELSASRFAEGGSLKIFNGKGDLRASIFQSTEGHGGIWLYDKDGEKSRGYTFC